MKTGTRYRIHMGCGEALQSRGWIRAKLRAAQAAAQQGTPSVVADPAARSKPGCKS